MHYNCISLTYIRNEQMLSDEATRVWCPFHIKKMENGNLGII